MLSKIDRLWNYSDPSDSETAFRELLEKAHGEPEYAAEVKTQIARALGLQRQFDESHALLDEVAEAVDDSMPLVRVRLALERGRAFRSSGAPEKGLPFFEEAMEGAAEGGFEFYAVDAAHMIALVYEGEEALAWHRKALAMAESAEDERARGWRGSLYNNLGWTYYELERFDEALALFVKHEAMLAESGGTYNEAIARWAQGKMLRAMARLGEALANSGGAPSAPRTPGQRSRRLYSRRARRVFVGARAWDRGESSLRPRARAAFAGRVVAGQRGSKARTTPRTR
jgi:tetratricopeptide (TPR) repeat protein